MAVAILVVAMGLIGPVDLAIHNPAPLIIQDSLKFVSAAIACVLILALSNRLRPNASGVVLVATLLGFIAVLCLVANATLSVYATSQAAAYAQEASAVGNQLNGIIGVLAMAAIVLNIVRMGSC